jgi:hypothetical protein
MTTQNPETDRVRQYLRTQGERYTFRELWFRAVKARLQLLDSLSDVNDDQAVFKIDENEWSILEVLKHVLTSSGNVAKLVEALANGESRPADDIEPPRESTDLSISEMRDLLLKDSVAWGAVTDRLPEPPSFEIEAKHMFFGDLHSRAWYLFQRVHDLDHAQQIDKNKQASNYPES